MLLGYGSFLLGSRVSLALPIVDDEAVWLISYLHRSPDKNPRSYELVYREVDGIYRLPYTGWIALWSIKKTLKPKPVNLGRWRCLDNSSFLQSASGCLAFDVCHRHDYLGRSPPNAEVKMRTDLCLFLRRKRAVSERHGGESRKKDRARNPTCSNACGR